MTNKIYSLIFLLLGIGGLYTLGTGNAFGSDFDSLTFSLCCFLASYTFRLNYLPAWEKDPSKA
jgi:hypothetical protein